MLICVNGFLWRGSFISKALYSFARHPAVLIWDFVLPITASCFLSFSPLELFFFPSKPVFLGILKSPFLMNGCSCSRQQVSFSLLALSKRLRPLWIDTFKIRFLGLLFFICWGTYCRPLLRTYCVVVWALLSQLLLEGDPLLHKSASTLAKCDKAAFIAALTGYICYRRPWGSLSVSWIDYWSCLFLWPHWGQELHWTAGSVV